jgi:16S rRNA (guanine527-N7)-methyltransferase
MFHVKHEGSFRAVGVPLSDDALHRLERYESSLRQRAIPRGMVARYDEPRLWERHILDSIRAAPLLPASGTVCDLGSGAGLPGVVLAIARPDLDFVLAEVRRARANFLLDVTADLPNVRVYDRRAETYEGPVIACTARALAPPAEAWCIASAVLAPGGSLVYWAGASFDPRDVPFAKVRRITTPGLAHAGALAIMTRQ